MFCSEALSSSAFSTYPACIHVLLYCTYSCTVVSVPIQGLVSVADRVAARVIARERRRRTLSNFHIVESMPKSVSKLIHYIHLVHGLILRLVYFLAPLVEIGSDLSVFCSVVITYTIIARAPRGATYKSNSFALKSFSRVPPRGDWI